MRPTPSLREANWKVESRGDDHVEFSMALDDAALARIQKTGSLKIGRWLHTATLDHPAALANYLKRGFVTFKEEEFDVNLPDQSPDPWPGAERPR